MSEPKAIAVAVATERHLIAAPFFAWALALAIHGAVVWLTVPGACLYEQVAPHWDKLMHRVKRGVGNPCPLLLIGLPAAIVVFDEAKVDQLSESDPSLDGES